MEFVETGEIITARTARRGIEALIGLLRERGVGEGDHVVVAMNRTPQSALWAYAVLAGNMALVPLSPYPEKNVADERIAHCDAAALIAADDYPAQQSPAVRIDPEGDESLRAVRRGADPIFRDINPMSVALILYTSGTVGRPKGVVLPHRSLVASYDNLASRLPYFKPGKRFLSFMPWYVPHGVYMNLIVSVFHGMIIIVDRAFDAFGPARFYSVLKERKPTICSLAPAILRAIHDFHERAQCPPPGSLEAICCASAPLTGDMRDWCREKWGVALHNNYGMTESASWVSIGDNRPGDEPGCVGRPHQDVIIADEKGRELPQGETGEILVAGDQVMREYYKDPKLTEEALRGGRFHTGDLGRFTEDGHLIIAGRIKEIINVAGLKVLPQNVESVALRIPGVAEATAFPIPDEKRGELVGLAIAPGKNAILDEKTIIRTLKKSLSAVEVPRRVFFLEKLPRNQSGKVLRGELSRLCGIAD